MNKKDGRDLEREGQFWGIGDGIWLFGGAVLFAAFLAEEI